MKTLKNTLKTQASEIKAFTKQIKENQQAGTYAGILQVKRHRLQLEHRLLHIAYSLNRSKTYEQIERKTRKDKVLSDDQWKHIKQIQAEHEVVRVDSQGPQVTV